MIIILVKSRSHPSPVLVGGNQDHELLTVVTDVINSDYLTDSVKSAGTYICTIIILATQDPYRGNLRDLRITLVHLSKEPHHHLQIRECIPL